MQFELNWARNNLPATGEALKLGFGLVPLTFHRNRRARRYILRVNQEGLARVTIPRGGSAAEARRFAERNKGWLERQMQRLATLPKEPKEWLAGSDILFRGELVKLEADPNGSGGLIRFGSEVIKVSNPSADLRPAIERHLWKLAMRELPPRVLEFATAHGLHVRLITVRNQRSRWGSCSRRGAISLNWRLVQAPPFVRDYIILHELMHLRQMNHSPKFWAEVEQACPEYRNAERWLSGHSRLLRLG